MASTTTLTAGTTTPYATLLNVAEAGTAAAAETVDIIALLTAAGLTAANSPLIDGIDQAFADQAAARAWLFANVDLIEYSTAASVATSETLYDANISGGVVANNFRLVITAVKAANADTYTKKCRFALRHSIVR
jgi:hypothetical protein